MQQHPVPQNIASYEFKLVGDMTLKQFFQLAGGLVISFIFYATPLPGVIKWPLVIVFGLLGAALAFLPIEERPLSSWVFAFFKAVYSPTLYTTNAQAAEEVFAKSSAPADTAPMPTSIPDQPEEVKKFEQGERNFISRISAMFSGPQHTTGGPVFNQQAELSVPQANQAQTFAPIVLSDDTLPAKPQTTPDFGKLRPEETAIPVPMQQSVKVGTTMPVPMPQQAPSPNVNQILTPVFSNSGNGTNTALQATFAPEAAPPAPPERPNTIVGQVITTEGKIVEGAILEIREAVTKTPVRALRSNKVGHFITVTPVQDGTYEIVTEKEGFAFDPVRFVAENRLIPPIQIKSK